MFRLVVFLHDPFCSLFFVVVVVVVAVAVMKGVLLLLRRIVHGRRAMISRIINKTGSRCFIVTSLFTQKLTNNHCILHMVGPHGRITIHQSLNSRGGPPFVPQKSHTERKKQQPNRPSTHTHSRIQHCTTIHHRVAADHP